MKRYKRKLRGGRRAPVKQGYWYSQAIKLAASGKTYWEIKRALPKLSRRSHSKLRNHIKVTQKQGWSDGVTQKAKVMRLMIACGYSKQKIARIYGIPNYYVTYFLNVRP